MSDSPQDDDFDWVSARLDCCEANELVHLRDFVKRNCARRNKSLLTDAPVQIKFIPVKDGKAAFLVETAPVSGVAGRPRIVWFELVDHGIRVRSNPSLKELPMTLAVRLNDDGECRFAVNSEGEYLRWQIARRVLEPLFIELSRT